MEKIKAIQLVLGVTPDGIWGPHTQAALDTLLGHTILWRYTKASSFADPSDIAAFLACKAKGKSDEECFKDGDNGVGYWKDDTTTDVPACALPPEDLEEKWGSLDAAHNRTVQVAAHNRQVTCLTRDTMPHRAHITNGAGIDLNPAAGRALALAPPFLLPAAWRWL